MFDGFYVADKLDLRTRRGIVYLVWFANGSWYCGSTSQSFRLRYGTLDLRKSALLANKNVKNHVLTYEYAVWLHCMEFSDSEQRIAKEYSVLGDRYRNDVKCLNKTNGIENLGVRRKVELRSPTGAIVEFESVKEAQSHIGATSHTQISGLLSGRFRSALGWTLPSYAGKKAKELLHKPCELIDPDGVLRRFRSQKEAQDAIGVASVVGLLNGTDTTLKGWTLPGVLRRKYLPVTVISPAGEVIKFPSRLAASKAIGCANQIVSEMCLGRRASINGWKLAGPCVNRVGR